MNGPRATLLESFAIQRRVVQALLLREVLTRYGRHNIGFLWLFLEPVLFTLGVMLLWSFAKAAHGSLPIAAFAITGYSSVLLWRNMPARCASAVEPNLSLLYHRHVKVIDLFIARILLEFLGVTASFCLLSAVFSIAGWTAPPEDVLQVAFGWVMLAWFGASLSLLIGSLATRSEIVDKIWHPASYLLFPLSGAVFMVDWLSPAVREIVLLLPMVHGVEIVREGYFGSVVRAHYDLGYMAAWCLALTLLGLAQERIVSRGVTPQ